MKQTLLLFIFSGLAFAHSLMGMESQPRRSQDGRVQSARPEPTGLSLPARLPLALDDLDAFDKITEKSNLSDIVTVFLNMHSIKHCHEEMREHIYELQNLLSIIVHRFSRCFSRQVGYQVFVEKLLDFMKKISQVEVAYCRNQKIILAYNTSEVLWLKDVSVNFLKMYFDTGVKILQRQCHTVKQSAPQRKDVHKKEFSSAKALYGNEHMLLCEYIYSFGRLASPLLSNSVCTRYALARLPEELMVQLLSVINLSTPCLTLINRAVQQFKAHPTLYHDFLLILQKYVTTTCAKNRKVKARAKGFLWEIAVSLFMLEHPEYTKLAINKDITYADGSRPHFAREFDILTEQFFVECKNRLWQSMEAKDLGEVKKQLVDQKALAESHEKPFIIISKAEIGTAFKKWLEEQGILYADRANPRVNNKLNFQALFGLPYFFDDTKR